MTAFIQRSFSGGEIAPSLYARVDQAKYADGLRTCRNHLIRRHGGASNRPGTKFVGEVKDSTKTVRLIPFVFSTSQTYVLEFGDQYMRVIKNGAQVTESPKTITGVTKANPTVVTSNSHGFSNGDEVVIAAISGMTQLNGRNFKVAGVTTNTFQLTTLAGANVDSSAYTTYTSGGTASRVYKIATPYAYTDLADIRLVQSADVVTLAHPTYAPRELARTADTSWTLTTITFGPSIAAPASLTATGGTGVAVQVSWYVTAVADTGEESVGFNQVGLSFPTSGSSYSLSWPAVTGATSYRLYRNANVNTIGTVGLLVELTTRTYTDTGATVDLDYSPPIDAAVFPSSSNYPSAVTYAQQRLFMANTTNAPTKVWGSQSANFKNFNRSTPLEDDDGLSFTLVGKQVNAIEHMVEVGDLIILTTAGEWAIQGDAAGIITPAEINPKQQTYNGSSKLAPIVADGQVLYVQARGNRVRDLAYAIDIDGYRGNDLTVFSAHLVDGYTLTDWTFQQIPNSIVWAVRSDGILLGLTYVREQQILAWHRHDFGDDVVENVCSVPEGTEDALYAVVKRTIGGATHRMIERFATREITDIRDAVFMDCALTYDGRNTGSTTMTLSGGTAWGYTETLTLTASASTFTSSDVGNQIFLTGSDGEIIRFTIAAYSSATVVTGTANRTVPASLKSTATTTWSRAVDQVTGLWHLEGQQVSILGDGYVVASPNNAKYDAVTVSSGTINLARCYAVIQVGIPYIADVETLNIDTPQGETVADKRKLVTDAAVMVEASRGLWAGIEPPTDDDTDPLENLNEFVPAGTEDFDTPPTLTTDTIEIGLSAEWNNNGRVFLRQVDPLPVSILAIIPKGLVPIRG